jgi:hypothetical protein
MYYLMDLPSQSMFLVDEEGLLQLLPPPPPIRWYLLPELEQPLLEQPRPPLVNLLLRLWDRIRKSLTPPPAHYHPQPPRQKPKHRIRYTPLNLPPPRRKQKEE